MLNFDRYMREMRNAGQLGSVVRRRVWLMRYDGCDRSQVSRPELPDVEIGDTIVANLQRRSYGIRNLTAWQCIEQSGGRTPHKVQSPNRYQQRAGTADQRINPSPAQLAGCNQRDNGKRGRKGIGDHVGERRAPIAVLMTRVCVVIMIAIVMVMIAVLVVAQQPGAHDVDH